MDLDFDELFRQHYAPLVRALAVAAGTEEAADAVQDAFLQAHRRWARVAGYERPDAWVRRVAVNRLTDVRRRRVRRGRAVERLGAGIDDAAPAPADLDLRRAVQGLPERQRLAVCLYYIADLSVEEVAETMDVTSGTVKSQLHDARQSLARTLGASHEH
jgi:RNA polymerase sigma-70 factor (ECF subfamily)